MSIENAEAFSLNLCVHERRINTHRVYDSDPLRYKVSVKVAYLFAQNERQLLEAAAQGRAVYVLSRTARATRLGSATVWLTF